jgi:hypothetical protein
MSEESPKATHSGFAEDCPCEQIPCPIRGDCVACVRAHRRHGLHLPECLQPILRDLVEQLARKVEYKVTDSRPTPEYWENQRRNQEAKGG